MVLLNCYSAFLSKKRDAIKDTLKKRAGVSGGLLWELLETQRGMALKASFETWRHRVEGGWAPSTKDLVFGTLSYA